MGPGVPYSVPGVNFDYNPVPGSPLIDTGDPGQLDPDGSNADIGAYGGPLGAW